jgi:hypothetical protein
MVLHLVKFFSSSLSLVMSKKRELSRDSEMFEHWNNARRRFITMYRFAFILVPKAKKLATTSGATLTGMALLYAYLD